MHITKRILAENYRYVDDALRSIKELGSHVDELLGLQKIYQRQINAALVLEITTQQSKSVKLSPETRPTEDVKIDGDLQKLRKNYKVVSELWAIQSNLESMEINIRQSFAGRDEDITRALSELAKLKKRVMEGLKGAFQFLKDLGDKHLPSGFKDFNGYMDKILSKSIAYEASNSYSYLYEVEGDLVFSTYFHLQRVVDEESNFFPNLFVITSNRLGRVSPGYYVAVSQEFTPPSADLLVRKVSTVKEATRALNLLLSLDNFNSSIGALPMNVLVNERNLKKELFLYQQYIKSIRFGEQAIQFVLRSEVTNKSDADNILIQMIKDFQPLVNSTKAKLNTAIKKGPNSYILTFFLVMKGEGAVATYDDLEFLRSRFNLDEAKMDKILKTINVQG
jgi:hypothetical protein